MTRRLAALTGLVVVLALVLLLFYRVWVHRQTIELYDDGGAVVERLDGGQLLREKFSTPVA